MWGEATAELDDLDPFCRALPDVLRARLAIVQPAGKGDIVDLLALRIRNTDSSNARWSILLQLRPAGRIIEGGEDGFES